MKTNDRTGTMVLSVTGMLLFSAVFLAADAFAQARGRSVRMPNNSAALRGGVGAPLASHSGGLGLKTLGSRLGSVGGGYYGHGSQHDHYSNAEAYRDVGIANAAVGLVGTLVGAYSYPAYPAVVAPPVPYAAAVVSSPGVIVGSYPYGYAPSPYVYSGYYGYGSSYYSPYAYPYGYYGYGASYYSPYTYPYGGYGYGGAYCNPHGTGCHPGHHGSHYYGGNHKQSGTWQSGHGGGPGQPGSWQNGRNGMQTPSHQGPGMQTPRSSYRGGVAPGMQTPRSAYRGGAAPSMSVSRGGGRPPQQSAMRPSGQSRRMR